MIFELHLSMEGCYCIDNCNIQSVHVKKFGAIHCVFPAGNAVVAATEVEEIVDAQWRDLGMPETLWHCRVKE